MKSTYIYEPSDFKHMGQMLIHQSAPVGCKDIGFMATVSYKIGWASNPGPNIVMKISLCDGMCVPYDSLDELCQELNTNREGYRPMTPEEIAAVMAYNGNRFPK